MKEYDIWGGGQNTDPSYVHLGSQDPLSPGSTLCKVPIEKAFAASWGQLASYVASFR